MIARQRDTAQRLLGGAGQVARAVEAQSTAAGLWLRPDDPVSRPVRGDRSSACHFLLRVTRSSGGDKNMKSVVIGSITTAYTFDRLADFQYLPSGLPRDVTGSFVGRVLASVDCKNVSKAGEQSNNDSADGSSGALPDDDIDGSAATWLQWMGQLGNLQPTSFGGVDRPLAYSYHMETRGSSAPAGSEAPVDEPPPVAAAGSDSLQPT